MWNKAREYLKKMAGIILWASIIVWFLSYFPRDNTKRVAKERQQNRVSGIQETASDNRIMNDHVLPADTIAFASQTPEVWQHDEQQNPSYLEQLGRVIEPVLRPIGFDWKIGVSLLSGIVAKEIVVSTLGVLYAGDDDRSLRSALQSQVHRSGSRAGQKIYTPPTTLALLTFILIYTPCIAVIAALKKESGSWKWAAFNVAYATTLAWILAFFVSKIAGLFF